MKVQLREEGTNEALGFGVAAVSIEEGIVGAGEPVGHHTKVRR
jgi:hypothetical protein